MTIEKVLEIIGAISSLCTVLAAVLPKQWKFTGIVAKVGTDLKGVTKHDK